MGRPSISSQRSNERSPLLTAQPSSSGLVSEDAIPSRSLTPTYTAAASTPRSRKLSTTNRNSLDHDSVPETARLLDQSLESPSRHHDIADIEQRASEDGEQIPFPSQTDPAKPLRPNNYRREKNVSKLRGFVARNEGILLLALAQLFFSTMNFFFKLINLLPPEESPPVTALEIIFIRMSITWVGCVAFMLASGVENPFLGPKEVRKLLALRGFVGFFGLFGLYYSLQYLSLADATVITFLGPLATGLLGFLVLGEPFTVRETLGGVISLSGVVLIARPAFIFGRKTADSDLDNPLVNLANTTLAENNSTLKVGEAIAKLVNVTSVDLVRRSNSTLLQGDLSVEGVTEKQRLFAVGLALLGVCGGAGAYITIRAIGRRASATHSVAYFSLYSTIVSAALMWFTDTKFVLPTQPKWIALLVCVGIFGLAAQILLAMGLQREKAGRAVSVTYLQIVYASLYQLVFLHVPIQPLSAIGMAVILVSAGWVAAAKA
ncbi:drug/metabolite transporter superfamily [Moesziomyces antarcticus]|uniref:Drug/metabolite transporter superfamily n=2 Tax=Pseudozyma antarctica TaxID=84753 RepID=A0A081CBU1_PSEA2|nr:drug/metabolite transporter superfamily [Moesziomyces antarcticus]GAK64137.1 drug/metabolite transporter superfamily [Moesziomyces antarcticus]SPO44643.1 uncharacterized protein PSANT_02328 [Moesziomyces antarcticus]